MKTLYEPKPKDTGFALSGTVLINVILSLGISVVLSVIAIVMVESGQYMNTQEAANDLRTNLGINWFIQILLHFLILAGGLIYLVIRKADIGREMGYKKFMSGKDLVLTILYTFSYIVIMLPINSIYISLLQALGYDVNTAVVSFPMFGSIAGIILAYFAIACLPPLSEELMFRGLAINGLKSLGKWPAVLLSSLCFAFMHMNPVQYLNAFCGGIVMGLVYWKTKSIWAGAIVHFINNAVSVTESLLIEVNQITDQVLNAFLANNLWVGLLFLLLILLSIVGIVLCTLYFAREKGKPNSAAPNPMYGGQLTAQTMSQGTMSNFYFYGGSYYNPNLQAGPAGSMFQEQKRRRNRDLLIGLAFAAPGIVVCLLMTIFSF